MNTYDFIVIGTGAGGSTIAYKLAQSGKKILIIERGDFIPKEPDNWNPKVVYTDGKYRTKEKWEDKDNKDFEPFTHYCVGGNTKMYGAALLRLRETDFREIKHYGGTSHAWPITYNDLEKYYTEAEKLYSVHGQRGIDPTDPPASEPYPFPAIAHEPRMQEMYDNLKKVGISPAPIALGVRLPEDKNVKKGKVTLSLFDGYPDPTETKSDAHVVCLNSILDLENVTLMTNCKVEQLLTDESGKKVNKVVCVNQSNETVTFEGDTVIVSCGAINSAALLLKSKSEKHPDGLANSSNLVGRNLMIHNNGTVVAVSKKRNDSEFQKSFYIADYYHGAEDSELPLGTIQLMGKTDPDTLRDELKELNPDKEFDVNDVANHSIDFFITAEDLADVNNRVTVDEEGKIKLTYTPNNTEAYEKLRKKLISLMDVMNCEEGYCKDGIYVGFKLGVSGVSHQNGTCRFGTDPKNSVLDIHCKAHDLENLYVIDSSFFCSSGAVNPSLTVIANALRVGEYLLNN